MVGLMLVAFMNTFFKNMAVAFMNTAMHFAQLICNMVSI